jgi:hypothetical protein
VLSPSAEAAAPAAPSEASPRTPESELVLEADSLLVGLAHLAVLAAKETRGQRRASMPEARLNSQERARGCRINAQGAGHWRRSGERQLERTEAHGQHERPRVITACTASATVVVTRDSPPAEALVRSVHLRPLSRAGEQSWGAGAGAASAGTGSVYDGAAGVAGRANDARPSCLIVRARAWRRVGAAADASGSRDARHRSR